MVAQAEHSAFHMDSGQQDDHNFIHVTRVRPMSYKYTHGMYSEPAVHGLLNQLWGPLITHLLLVTDTFQTER